MAERRHRDSYDSLMKSEQRSPIMTAGAWVLPRVTVGIIDVSAMRRPSTPCTRNFGSTSANAAASKRAVGVAAAEVAGADLPNQVGTIAGYRG